MSYITNHWPMLSKPAENPASIVLSLGAGVQSTTLALMAARRDIGPMPDYAVFADTGGESRRVYKHLDWLDGQLPFPIIRVRRDGDYLGPYHTKTMQVGLKGRSSVPLHLAEPTGMMAKQCSKEFKTRPVQREIRRRAGLLPRQRAPKGFRVEVWIGMSKDEMMRVKQSEASYIHNRHPLVEADMTRQDCLNWLALRQYPIAPASSCIFCPFRDKKSWISMAKNEPEDFAVAVQYDEAWRDGYPGMEGQAFIHQSRKPLRDLVLDAPSNQFELQIEESEQCDACGS